MNSVNLTGRLTSDPELRQTQSGVSVVRFTIAVDRPYQKDKDKKADFIPCIAWRNTAEFVSRNFSKGDPIEVSGALRTGSYQDKKHEDVTHYTMDVLVSNVSFTLSKAKQENGSTGRSNDNRGRGDDADFGKRSDDYDLSDFEEILSDGDVPF